jgi:hypothetical protein
MLRVDLTWTPTSRLLGELDGRVWVARESVTTLRCTGQYHDAFVAGDHGLPTTGSFAVTSEFGTIYTRAMGSMELWITRGQGFARPDEPSAKAAATGAIRAVTGPIDGIRRVPLDIERERPASPAIVPERADDGARVLSIRHGVRGGHPRRQVTLGLKLAPVGRVPSPAR